MGKFWPSAIALLLLGCAASCLGDDTCLYQGEDGAGYLRIERLPDPHVVPMPSRGVAIQTKAGVRELTRFSNGDCEGIFFELLWRSGEASRLVVETKDQSYYSILLDHKFAPTATTVAEVADKLGLEIAHARRRKLAYLIRANDKKPTGIERFQGQPKWPEATQLSQLNSSDPPELTYGELVPHRIMKFPSGGIFFVRCKYDDDNSVAGDDNLYFDGVTCDDLAQYFEATLRFPVLSQTTDTRRYSFTLPSEIWKQFSFKKTVPLPGLGFSVTSGEAEMNVILVRDKSAVESANK